MLNDPLPSTLDVRKAAARDVVVEGVVRLDQLPRFAQMLASQEGAVEARLSCSRDEEQRYIVDITVTADVEVICQRCLGPMREALHTGNRLAVVWTDEQAAQLPRHLDPLIVEEQQCDVYAVIEDELILAMPAFSYHDTEACSRRTVEILDPSVGPEKIEERPNPFEALAALKSSD